MDTKIDLDAFRPWLERSDSSEETLSPIPALCLAATLNLGEDERPAGTLPPLWHWLHFLDRTPTDGLGEDGSPRSRSLLPPIPLEQIMWAGSEIEFEAPLALGQPARKVSRIADMTAKTGSRGPMVFLTHEHRYEQHGRTAIVERTRAVFLGPSTGAAPAAAPAPAADRQLDWPMDETTLFRFSALTFNTHRIHYDLRYATEVGGYPGLVVHGPLQAMLIAETFRKWHPGRSVRRMEFRARASLFCGAPVAVCAAAPEGQRLAFWTRTPAGGPAMECVISCA